MYSETPDRQFEVNKKTKNKLSGKIFVGVVVAVLIFIFGVKVGEGALPVGPDSALKQSVSDDSPDDLSYKEVEQLYDALRNNFDGKLKTNSLLEGLKDGLAGSTGDVYTEYLSPKEAKAFDEDLNGTFSGIGAELSKDEQSVVIVAPISGFPAEQAGLKPQDIIAEIDGESAFDIGLTEAVNKIRGPAGTKVKLTIIRDSERLEFDIARAQITIPSVESEILEGNIGYLQVSRFSEDTYELALEAARDFEKSNVKGVILDVRSNPGGLLDAAVDLSGIWLDPGKVVLEERRDGVTVDTMTSSGPATLKGIPTVVLINEGSASASEIVAGALKDNKAATLIGQKSFGKGSVQQLVNLEDGGVLKVTIARWYTPDGRNLDKDGIVPDKKVKITEEDTKNERDPQRQSAINQLKQ